MQHFCIKNFVLLMLNARFWQKAELQWEPCTSVLQSRSTQAGCHNFHVTCVVITSPSVRGAPSVAELSLNNEKCYILFMSKGVLKRWGVCSFTNVKTYTLSGKYTYHYLSIILVGKRRCHCRFSKRCDPLTHSSTILANEINGKHTLHLKEHTIHHTLFSC